VTTWLKKLFHTFDRGEAASDRIADALEGIATDLEAVRSVLRKRIGLDDADQQPTIEKLPPAPSVWAKATTPRRRTTAAKT
jgi:hypothetical protein